jgi:UTP-glucose-1-phosphate uridylyltransferase
MNSSNKPTLAVLAAGIGRRYGGLKQIEPVGPSGEIVIDYSIFDAIGAGFGKLLFVIRREIEDTFKSVIEPHFAGRIPIEYAFQELNDMPSGFTSPQGRTKPWGTGHAVYACRHACREPFAVINSDDFYGRISFQLLADRLQSLSTEENLYCLVAFILRNTLSDHGPVSRGVCHVGAGHLLKDIVEHHQVERKEAEVSGLRENRSVRLTGEEPVSMNLWGFTPTIFSHLEREFRIFLSSATDHVNMEFQLPTVLDLLIHQGRASVQVLYSSERWLGVTYPEDKPRVAAGILDLVKSGVYPPKLWA